MKDTPHRSQEPTSVAEQGTLRVQIAADGRFKGTSNVGTLTVWSVKGKLSGATTVVMRRGGEFVTNSGGAANRSAMCEAGERAVGGGAGRIDDAAGGVQIEHSKPIPTTTGSTPTGWNARVASTMSGLTVAVYVIRTRP